MSPSALPLLLACAAALGSGDPTEDLPLERVGAHFRILCHFDSAPVADACLAAAEAAWDAAARVLGPGEEGLEEPLTVHVYRGPAEYAEAEQAITGGVFLRNLAFSHRDSRTAHVSVQPPVTDGWLGERGVPALTLRMVAHEACHLVRYRRFSNSASHPKWFGDGLASWVDQVVCEDLGVVPAGDRDPIAARRVHLVRALFDRGGRAGAGQVLAGSTVGLGFYGTYAARALLFEYLLVARDGAPGDGGPGSAGTAEGPPVEAPACGLLDELLEVIRTHSPEGDRDPRRELTERLHRSVGHARLDAVDAGWRAWIAGRLPRWNEEVRSLQREGDGWLQVAFPADRALAWRTGHAVEVGEELDLTWSRGTAGIEAGASACVRLGCEGDPLALVLGGDRLAFRAGTEPLAWAGPAAGDGPVTFRLTRTEGVPLLRVGDQEAVPLPEPAARWDGRFGLETDPGAVSAWSGPALLD